MNLLVSACLLGVNCRYDGTGQVMEEIKELMTQYHLIPVCPEIYGGLTTPREPAEKVGDKIQTKTGKDVTKNYQRGANEILKLAKLYDCNYAILKERSPSCGYGKIYDGTFSGKLVEGNGILADMLEKQGIKVFGETKIKELEKILLSDN
jgi:uncharacterized protein YbbK (DUF523 family)